MLWGVRQSYRRLVYKYVSDNTEVCLPTLKAGRFHMFLSHQQQHGQDQVEVIKYRLETLVPGIRLFIDTDLSNTGRGLQNVLELKNFVKESELVVFFITDGYFKSFWCVEEMQSASERVQPMALVMETDPRHGGLSIQELQEDIQQRDVPVCVRDESLRLYCALFSQKASQNVA